MDRRSIYLLCNQGLMIAMYFMLAKLTIPIGSLHITLAPLPILVMAILYGPKEAAVVAVVGEFLIQVFGRYGLTPITPLWCLPTAARALVAGFGFQAICHHYNVQEPFERRVPYYAVLVISSLITTLCNTAVIWLDSII